MSDRSNPGPPLVADDEFCACQPPSAKEYLKASAAALLVILAGAGAWLGLALLLQRIPSLAGVLIGPVAGWAIHRAAGRRKSLPLGIMAAASSVLVCVIGFVLLWLPVFSRLKLPRQLSWYDLIMIALGALAAYSLAGRPDRRSKSL